MNLTQEESLWGRERLSLSTQLSVMSFQLACDGIFPKIPPLLSCVYAIFVLLGRALVTYILLVGLLLALLLMVQAKKLRGCAW